MGRLFCGRWPPPMFRRAPFFVSSRLITRRLLIDEADTFLGGQRGTARRPQLRPPQRRSGAARSVGDDFEPRSFATYSAVAIGLIGQLPGTLADRSVTVDLKRKRRAKPPTPSVSTGSGILWCWPARPPVGRRQCRPITAVDPDMPDGLYNREADNWRPLFAIADGGGRRVAAAGTRGSDAGRGGQRRVSLLELLLGDIRDIFAKRTENKVDSRTKSRPRIWSGPGCDRGTPLGGAWEEPQAAHAEPAGPPAQAARHRPETGLGPRVVKLAATA